MSNETFEQAMDRFLACVQGHINDYFHREYTRVDPPILEATYGAKYVRIVSHDAHSTGGSAFCFIEQATGNVLKAAGWKVPAKGVRGSIYSLDFSGYGVDHHGAKYLR